MSNKRSKGQSRGEKKTENLNNEDIRQRAKKQFYE